MKKRDLTDEERALWRDEMHGRRKPAPKKQAEAAPPAKKSAPAAPIRLEGRAARKQLKSYGKEEAVLDLHGYSKLDARDKTKSFLQWAQSAGVRHVLVVTGKGKGILRDALPGWLEDWPSLVAAMAPSAPEKGGEGALHVVVRKKR